MGAVRHSGSHLLLFNFVSNGGQTNGQNRMKAMHVYPMFIGVAGLKCCSITQHFIMFTVSMEATWNLKAPWQEIPGMMCQECFTTLCKLHKQDRAGEVDEVIVKCIRLENLSINKHIPCMAVWCFYIVTFRWGLLLHVGIYRGWRINGEWGFIGIHGD